MVVSIDLHSSKPCFSVQFVDTYSIHSFPPPSRRTQQIQPFPQSGAGVCLMKLGVGELGVGELGVGELAGVGAFQDALQ